MKRQVMFRRTLIGAGLTALVAGVSTALAGSGVGGVFNLGEVNTVNAQTTLNGNAGGNPQLRVENAATAQNTFGVLGRITAGSPAGQTAGVRGINSGTNANGFGVWGFHQGFGAGVFGEAVSGTGVIGRHTSSSIDLPGVLGETQSNATDAYGVHGMVTGANPGAGAAGVRGTIAADNGNGVFGVNTGSGDNSVGVFGRSSGGDGVLGQGDNTGGSFLSPGSAVYGCSAPPGGQSPCERSPSIGVGVGGQFRSKGPQGTSVLGCAGTFCTWSFGAPFGAQFSAGGSSAVGVQAVAHAGSNGSNTIGVSGFADGPGSIGGRFISPDGFAGRFEGHVHTTGRITKAYTSGTSSQAIPIAYGTVRATDGVLLSGTPNVSSSYDATNHRYVVTIANETYTTPGYITSLTPTTSAQPRFATTSASSGNLLVRIFDHNGALQQAQFSFITYKP
jgi:hypothetical protein